MATQFSATSNGGDATSTQSTSKAAELFAQLAAVCPVPSQSTSDIITAVVDEDHQLGKQFSVAPDGTIDKQAAVSVSRGIACQFHVPNLATLEKVMSIASENPNAAIINAVWKHAALGEVFTFLSTKLLAGRKLAEDAVTIDCGMKAFARLKVHATPSSWQLLDRDEDQYTPEWAKKQTFAEWRETLDKILPGIERVKMLRAHSSSARVLRADGSPVGGGNGHVWIKIADAADAERARTAIIARSIEQDLVWTKPKFSKTTGEECAKSHATIIDASVWTIGRLVFVGRPTCSPGLIVSAQKFEHIDGKNEALDTSQAVINEFKTVRASAKKGIKLKLKPQKSKSGAVVGFHLVVANLTMGTELELADGSVRTVRELMSDYSGKVRCQAPFRPSTSMAAFFALGKNGEPFVGDSGTNTLHVLAGPGIPRKIDRDRDQLVREVRASLAGLIGQDNADVVLDEENLCAVWDAAFFSPANSKTTILNSNHALVDLSVKDALSFGFRREYGRLFHSGYLDDAIQEMNLDEDALKELHRKLDNLASGPLMETLKLYKQARSLDISIDIFATKGRMTVTDGIATVSLPHRPFEPAMAIDPAVVKQTYEDYIQHFPEFAAFLDLVLHARFATDRRHAFVWLHSSSSWGKGLLLAIFSKLGIVVDVSTKEIDKALEGSPVGLSMNDMLRAWILFVDEFKAASSELKLLNTQITLAPKNQLRCTVPLFTKLFASAESVRSLVGDGVESQFNNRFAYLSPSTHEQKIEDRPLFKDLGKSVYVGALANYVAGYLNAGVERLRAMGPVESSKVADVFLETYQAAHRLQATFGNLDDAVDDVVAEIRKCLIEYATWADTDYRSNILPDSVAGIGPALLATLKRSVLAGYISEGDGSKQRQKAIVLSDAEKFVKSYLALSGDRSTVGKMQYKSGEITAKLHMRLETFSASTRVRVYDAETGTTEKANKRGVVIFLPDPVATSSSNDGSWKKWSSDNL